jgi:hypothetical protein
MPNSSWVLASQLVLPDIEVGDFARQLALIITDSATELVAATSSVRLVARTTYTCTARRCPPFAPGATPSVVVPPPPPPLSSVVVLGKYLILT